LLRAAFSAGVDLGQRVAVDLFDGGLERFAEAGTGAQRGGQRAVDDVGLNSTYFLGGSLQPRIENPGASLRFNVQIRI